MLRRVVAVLALWAAYCVGHAVGWEKMRTRPQSSWFDGRSGS